MLLLQTNSTAGQYRVLPAEGEARDDALVVGQLGQDRPVGNIPDQDMLNTGTRGLERSPTASSIYPRIQSMDGMPGSLRHRKVRRRP